MRMSERVKPISYFKANAAEILADLAETREPMAITVNGEVKAIVQDIRSYEKAGETLALLKLLALAEKDIADGKTKPMDKVFDRLEAKYR